MITPHDWEHDLSVHRGATFNLAHSLTRCCCFRPRNRFEDLDGVYLVGGGTHPGSGLPVIFERARITRRLLADDLGLTAMVGGPRWRRRIPPVAPMHQDHRCRRPEPRMTSITRRRHRRRPGGLAAACTLAARGHKVVLFEKNTWLGGKAAVFEQDGYRFDMGPTILTVPRVLERIFAEAGERCPISSTCVGSIRNGAASSRTAPCWTSTRTSATMAQRLRDIRAEARPSRAT